MEFVEGSRARRLDQAAPAAAAADAAGAGRAAARRAGGDPQGGLPAPRHQARQHLHARRRHARCCSTSARRASARRPELTAVVSPGYAPFEQYHTQGNQGPWSDLYALGGVLYWMVTGNKPVEAAARVREDNDAGALTVGDRGRYRAAVPRRDRLGADAVRGRAAAVGGGMARRSCCHSASRTEAENGETPAAGPAKDASSPSSRRCSSAWRRRLRSTPARSRRSW